jgi:hypothetical protein
MLPGETRNYVAAVTGVPVDEWAKSGSSKPAVKTTPNCRELMAHIEMPSDPRHGMVKQPASSQEPPLSSRVTPAQPDDAQFFKEDRIEASSSPTLGDLVTLHQPSYSQSHINLFLEKLTERVGLLRIARGAFSSAADSRASVCLRSMRPLRPGMPKSWQAETRTS